jgi:hypothetical protein
MISEWFLASRVKQAKTDCLTLVCADITVFWNVANHLPGNTASSLWEHHTSNTLHLRMDTDSASEPLYSVQQGSGQSSYIP